MSNPIKPSFKTEWFSLVLIVLSFLAAYYFYQSFPDRVPTHWNFQGEVNGYSSPLVASILMPVISLVVYLIFIFMPYFDPKKEQYAKFSRAYHAFKDLLIAFLFATFMMIGLNGIGYPVNIGFWMPIMIGLLFVVIGFLLDKVKMNWFMGIRTPWTLSSEEVWRKTHKLSSKVLMVSGVLIALTSLVPNTAKIVLFIIAVVLIVLAMPIYSFILYSKENKKK